MSAANRYRVEVRLRWHRQHIHRISFTEAFDSLDDAREYEKFARAHGAREVEIIPDMTSKPVTLEQKKAKLAGAAQQWDARMNRT